MRIKAKSYFGYVIIPEERFVSLIDEIKKTKNQLYQIEKKEEDKHKKEMITKLKKKYQKYMNKWYDFEDCIGKIIDVEHGGPYYGLYDEDGYKFVVSGPNLPDCFEVSISDVIEGGYKKIKEKDLKDYLIEEDEG